MRGGVSKWRRGRADRGCAAARQSGTGRGPQRRLGSGFGGSHRISGRRRFLASPEARDSIPLDGRTPPLCRFCPSHRLPAWSGANATPGDAVSLRCDFRVETEAVLLPVVAVVVDVAEGIETPVRPGEVLCGGSPAASGDGVKRASRGSHRVAPGISIQRAVWRVRPQSRSVEDREGGIARIPAIAGEGDARAGGRDSASSCLAGQVCRQSVPLQMPTSQEWNAGGGRVRRLCGGSIGRLQGSWFGVKAGPNGEIQRHHPDV